MDHDDGQGPIHPGDLDHLHNTGTQNHPPGIPNPAVNYVELIQAAERYKQLLAQAQMQNLQTIQALNANQNTMEAQMLKMQQNIQQLINTANAKEAEHARALEETEN